MQTLPTLPLPPLVGTRRRAQALVHDLPGDLHGAAVVIDCRELVAATESFADELIDLLVLQRGAQRLDFVNVTDSEFANWVDERAAAQGVEDRVTVDRCPQSA